MEKAEIEEALYMALKQISKRTAQKKYGICISDNGRYYLRDDGCVVDSAGLVR